MLVFQVSVGSQSPLHRWKEQENLIHPGLGWGSEVESLHLDGGNPKYYRLIAQWPQREPFLTAIGGRTAGLGGQGTGGLGGHGSGEHSDDGNPPEAEQWALGLPLCSVVTSGVESSGERLSRYSTRSTNL